MGVSNIGVKLLHHLHVKFAEITESRATLFINNIPGFNWIRWF